MIICICYTHWTSLHHTPFWCFFFTWSFKIKFKITEFHSFFRKFFVFCAIFEAKNLYCIANFMINIFSKSINWRFKHIDFNTKLLTFKGAQKCLPIILWKYTVQYWITSRVWIITTTCKQKTWKAVKHHYSLCKTKHTRVYALKIDIERFDCGTRHYFHFNKAAKFLEWSNQFSCDGI